MNGINGSLDGTQARRQSRCIGRPTRLNPALAEQLVAAVRETGWIRPAALRCGVNEAMVREWVQRGKGEHPSRGATREYAAFAAAIARAQGEWEAHQLAVLDEAASKKPESWGAAAWKLERFDRERYGRHDSLDVSGRMTVVEMRAFFVAVIGLLERYVPPERLESGSPRRASKPCGSSIRRAYRDSISSCDEAPPRRIVVRGGSK